MKNPIRNSLLLVALIAMNGQAMLAKNERVQPGIVRSELTIRSDLFATMHKILKEALPAAAPGEMDLFTIERIPAGIEHFLSFVDAAVDYDDAAYIYFYHKTDYWGHNTVFFGSRDLPNEQTRWVGTIACNSLAFAQTARSRYALASSELEQKLYACIDYLITNVDEQHAVVMKIPKRLLLADVGETVCRSDAISELMNELIYAIRFFDTDFGQNTHLAIFFLTYLEILTQEAPEKVVAVLSSQSDSTLTYEPGKYADTLFARERREADYAKHVLKADIASLLSQGQELISFKLLRARYGIWYGATISLPAAECEELINRLHAHEKVKNVRDKGTSEEHADVVQMHIEVCFV